MAHVQHLQVKPICKVAILQVEHFLDYETETIQVKKLAFFYLLFRVMLTERLVENVLVKSLEIALCRIHCI